MQGVQECNEMNITEYRLEYLLKCIQHDAEQSCETPSDVMKLPHWLEIQNILTPQLVAACSKRAMTQLAKLGIIHSRRVGQAWSSCEAIKHTPAWAAAAACVQMCIYEYKYIATDMQSLTHQADVITKKLEQAGCCVIADMTSEDTRIMYTNVDGCLVQFVFETAAAAGYQICQPRMSAPGTPLTAVVRRPDSGFLA